MGGGDTQSVNGTQPVYSIDTADLNNIKIKNMGSDGNEYKKAATYHGEFSVNCRGMDDRCHSFTKKDVSFSAAIVKANFYAFGAGLEAILTKHL